MRPIWVTAVVVLGSGFLFAQTAPVKMGLWEKTMVTSNGDGPPTTMKAKDCITPEAWQQMLNNTQKAHDGCKMNTGKTTNSYSFNGTCNMQGTSMEITGSTTIADSEHIVSESHSTVTMNGKTRKLEIRSTSRFVSSSCGSVKPGNPEIEN